MKLVTTVRRSRKPLCWCSEPYLPPTLSSTFFCFFFFMPFFCEFADASPCTVHFPVTPAIPAQPVLYAPKSACYKTFFSLLVRAHGRSLFLPPSFYTSAHTALLGVYLVARASRWSPPVAFPAFSSHQPPNSPKMHWLASRTILSNHPMHREMHWRYVAPLCFIILIYSFFLSFFLSLPTFMILLLLLLVGPKKFNWVSPSSSKKITDAFHYGCTVLFFLFFTN